MNKKLKICGGVLTAVYLLGIAIVAGLKFQGLQALKLNELGDFLAGVFGPIAFLWLVLVFIQQARELKLSSDALFLQANELKCLVEQQTIIAHSTTEYLKLAIEVNKMNKAEMERCLEANFEVLKSSENYIVVPGVTGTTLIFKNHGNDASDVQAVFTPMIKGAPFFLGEIRRGDSKSYPFSTINYGEAEMEMRYTGVDGQRRTEFYTYTVTPVPYDVVFQRKPPQRLDQLPVSM